MNIRNWVCVKKIPQVLPLEGLYNLDHTPHGHNQSFILLTALLPGLQREPPPLL